MAKLRKGDTVVVIAGKDKGKQGTILAVKADRVKVEGINIVTKHQNLIKCWVKRAALLSKKHFYIFQMLQFIMQQPKKQTVLLTR